MTFQSFQTVQAAPNAITLTTSSILFQLQRFGPRLPSLWITDQLNRAALVQRARLYARGDHDFHASKEMRELLGVLTATYSPFADSYMDAVIQSFVDRCIMQSVEAPGNTAGTQWANDVWEYTRMDGLQSDVAEATIRDGDSFVLPSWDEELQQVRLTLEEAYDGTMGMLAFYRSKSIPIMDCAIKIWQIALDYTLNVLTRVNIYYTDHVEKYYGINQAPLQPWQGGDISIPQYSPKNKLAPRQPIIHGGTKTYLTATDVSQPTPSAVIHFAEEEPIQYYTMRDGTPLGIPVIHFRNRGRQNYGYSEIKNAMPLQDALNRILYSLVINAEYNGFGIRWTRGFRAPQALRPGTLIEISPDQPMTRDQLADMGMIPAGDMGPFIQTAKWLTAEIGKVTRTPTTEFDEGGSAGRVSGEALKMREIGLIGKANRFMVKSGNAWEDVFRMAHRMQEAYGNQSPPPITTFKSIWRSPEIRDDAQVVQNAMALRPVVGDAQTLRFVAPVLDLDEGAIQQILQEKSEENIGKLAALSGVPAFTQFNEPGAPQAMSNGAAQPQEQTAVQPPDVQGENVGGLEAATTGTQEVTTQ